MDQKFPSGFCFVAMSRREFTLDEMAFLYCHRIMKGKYV